MVLIKVKDVDKAKVFKLLLKNGKFMGLPDNRFNILENEEEMLAKLKEEDIDLVSAEQNEVL